MEERPQPDQNHEHDQDPVLDLDQDQDLNLKLAQVLVLTFLTVATQMADRLRGSMASSFIPSWNQEPLWSTSFTCTGDTAT